MPVPTADQLPELSDAFREFLIEAQSQHGYGQPGAQTEELPNGSKRIVYGCGEFLYTDTFEGGVPYSGHATISADVDGRIMPIWGMAYKQTLDRMPASDLGNVLSSVLAIPDWEFPIRGPRLWRDGDTRYRLQKVSRDSTLEDFDGEELIRVDRKLLYAARFMGGLVNRLPELEATNPSWIKHE